MSGVGVTNFQLERRLKGVPGFAGVFTKDTLPAKPKGTSLIVNACDAPGCHWVAMRFDGPDGGQFFDPYGLPPDQSDLILDSKTHFAEYLAQHSRRGEFTSNRRDLQCVGTAVCGDYCAYWILHGDIKDNRPAWAPILAQKKCIKRDRKVRELAGVTTNMDIGTDQTGIALVRVAGEQQWQLEARR